MKHEMRCFSFWSEDLGAACRYNFPLKVDPRQLTQVVVKTGERRFNYFASSGENLVCDEMPSEISVTSGKDTKTFNQREVYKLAFIGFVEKLLREVH